MPYTELNPLPHLQAFQLLDLLQAGLRAARDLGKEDEQNQVQALQEEHRLPVNQGEFPRRLF